MLRVGLTGGIASGKSTISDEFENLGITVIDTDKISHALMQPGQTAYQKTLDHFGMEILNPDFSINRALLRELVFNQPRQKTWIEDMLHPLIRKRALEMMEQCKRGDYLLLVVPLMYESGFDELVDHVVAIDCPSALQVERLMARDGISTHLARAMIDAQMNNEERLQHADSRLANRSGRQQLQRQVRQLHQRLLELAAKYASNK